MSKSSWDIGPSDFQKVFENDLTSMQKNAAVTAIQGVVLQSPVDTGAFRASHRVSIDKPDLGFSKSLTDKNGSSTIAKGTATIAKLVPYSIVYIQTNLPYAHKIEYGGFTAKPETVKTINGYSRQAPKGVYSLTFTKVADMYK